MRERMPFRGVDWVEWLSWVGEDCDFGMPGLAMASPCIGDATYAVRLLEWGTRPWFISEWELRTKNKF